MKVDMHKFRVVTFDDGGALRTSVVGGVVDIGLVGGLGFLPLLQQIRPLLSFDPKRQPPFDAPSVTEVDVGAPLDYVQGSLRGFAVSTSFKDKYPDRYEIVVKAYQKVFEDDDVTKALEKAKLGTGWFGPDDSNKVYLRSFDELKKYSDLLKGA
jgi:tripartite-type tricarboxylate transporter receptor subunit TctC